MTGEKGYSLVIPEGTVIAENGDPVVNPRNTLPVNGNSRILDIQVDGGDVNTAIHDLSGRNILNPKPGQIYIINGQKVIAK